MFITDNKMAATAATTFTIGSATSLSQRGSSLPQSKPFDLRFKSQNSLKNFCGLKAASNISYEAETSFLGKETCAGLRASIVPKAQKTNQNFQYHLQPQASYKVAFLGAAGGIGQSSALIIKMAPLVSDLHLYDIANVKGVAADLSHCNTPSQDKDFTGASKSADALEGVDVVVIPAGVPRKPGMTHDNC